MCSIEKKSMTEKEVKNSFFVLIFDLNYHLKSFYILHEINGKWLFHFYNKKSIFMLQMRKFRHYYSVNLTQGASMQSDLKPKHLAYAKD